VADLKKWCREILGPLPDGGVWIIPRSGVVFRKHGKILTWVATIPPEDMLFRVAPHLGQESEYEVAREKFAKAGIAVVRAELIHQHADAKSAMEYWRKHNE
jgi:hypothetical protein